MELIDIIPEFNLYEEFWRIYTKGDVIPPQYISADAVVDKCIIGEGTEIYGEVHNSVIGPNVIIGKGSVIRDSIIMKNTAVGENLASNDISSDRFHVLQGNIIDDKSVQAWAGYEKYDIVVANILADVIIMLVKEIPVHLKKGGYFITSGIINLKEEAVRAAFAASEELEVVEITYQGEWLSVTARKK